MDKETKDVLLDIKKMLAESKAQKQKEGMNIKVISPYESMSCVVKKKKKKQPLPSLEYTKLIQSKDEAFMRSLSLPYIDNLMFVDETLKLIESKPQDDNNVDFEYKSTRVLKKFKSKYPRFLEGLEYSNFETLQFKKRSDIWLARLIEECYDAAIHECSKNVSQTRIRIRFDLDLGALDTFPMCVRRYISQKYSALLQQNICFELLLAIEKVITNVEQFQNIHSKNPDSYPELHGGRIVLFSSFLSEESELNILAAFLQSREIAQNVVGVKFRDMIHQMVFSQVTHEGGNFHAVNEVSTSTTLSEESDGVVYKECPIIQLPHWLRFVYDYTQPEAPLLCCDIRSVRIIINQLLVYSPSILNAPLSDYLLKKCLYWTYVLSRERRSLFQMLITLNNAIELNQCKFEGFNVNSLVVVPIYVLLWVIANDMKRLSTRANNNSKSNNENSILKIGDYVTPQRSLIDLNNMYLNDNAMIKELDTKIEDTKIELSKTEAQLLKLQKKQKYIERKWSNHKPDKTLDGSTSTTTSKLEVKEYDLDELIAVKLDITCRENERSAIDSHLKQLIKQKKQLADTIDERWESAQTAPGTRISAKRSKSKEGKKYGQWRDVSIMQISQIVALSYDLMKIELSVIREDIDTGHSDKSMDLLETKTFEAVDDLQILSDMLLSSSKVDEYKSSDAEMIAEIEKEAHMLRDINSLSEPKGKDESDEIKQSNATLFSQFQFSNNPNNVNTSNIEISGHDMSHPVATLPQEETNRHEVDPEIKTITEGNMATAEDVLSVSKADQIASDEIAQLVSKNDDESPENIVNDELHRLVEVRFQAASRKHFIRTATIVWRILLCETKVNRHLRHKHHILLRKILKDWLYVTNESTQLRHVSAFTIQMLARRYISKNRLHAAREMKIMIDSCLVAVRLERGLKYFRMFCCLQKKKERLKAAERIVRTKKTLVYLKKWLISHRRFLARLKKKKLDRQKELIAIYCRIYLARKRVNAIRCRARCLAESTLSFHIFLGNVRKKLIFRHWKRFRKCCVIMKGILKLAMHTIVYKRWQIWKKDAMDYLKLKNEKALVLQSASRMWKVQSQVLHYYAFRRRLIQLQTTARIRIAMRLLRTKQWQHWAAVHIQRIGRGYILRSTMTKKRVLDIHFCASNNKYERLEYYCKKYLNLTYIADESGNYAIHNAAKYAQKRALRCLLKYGHDPLSWNRDGFNALHLVVLSSGAQRDETFHFLLEYGVDIHILSLDYRSCLMLAVQNERVAIAKVCLENGLRPDDLNGYFSSCLQIACITGYEIMAKTLIDHGADVNLADAKGMHPLHNAAISGNLEIAKMLVINGANLNVYEYENGQTPFMLACSRGLKSMVDYFISEGANPHALDYAYRNAAFNAVESDVSEVIGSLREVDVNFDCADSEGNTPLHYAAELGHVNAARELIYCGASPTIQNLKGNQPSHIAAKFNKVPVLKLLIDYDDHIARMNYSHQTPLGMAKFSLSREAQLFLEDYIAKIEGPNGRNEFGDVWWDRNLDQAIGDWRVEVDYGNHRVYVNDKTGERSKNPPMLPYNTVRQAAVYAEVPHRKRVKKLEEENTVNLNTYNNELAAQEKEIERERKIYRNATIIQKYVRMKLAKMKAVRMRHADREFKILFKYLRRAIRVYRQWKSMMNARKLVKIQALYRGYSLRRHFYHLDGTFQYLWKEYMKRRLARSIWTLWRNFNLQKMKTISFLVLHGPKLMSEWEQVLDVCQRPIRTVGVYEEYYYPQNRVIKFYRNTVNGNITYHKPQSMCVLDANNHKVKTQLRTLGFTPSQLRLSIKVQALWRGYIVRNNYKFIVKATRLCLNSESLYLENPTSDRNLFNYALYTHVVVNDIEKARILYAEVLRRMQFKGPDIPQILYAYAIFSFVTHDQDFNDCYHYIEKGREAEYNNVNYIRKQNMKKQLQLTEQECLNVYKNIDISHGKVFKLADVGFFKYTASRNQTSMAWHNYAACRFLVYDDFPGSFDAFMNAIKCDPMNSRLVSNYWVMMRHFFKTQDEIEMVVNQRMQMKAIKAQNDINERIARVNMAKLRETSAKYIQRWYRFHKGLKDFYKTVKYLRGKKGK